MNGSTGNNEIPDTGKSAKGLNPSSHSKPDTAHLRNSSGDQSRLGIISVSKAVGNTRRQSNHIFQSAAQFNPKHIRAGVHAEYLIHKNILNKLGSLSVMRSGYYGSGKSPSYLFGMARAGKHGRTAVRNLLFHNLRQGHKGGFLNTLGNIYNNLSVLHKGRHTASRTSGEGGRNCQYHQFRAFDAALQVRRNMHILRQLYTGKLILVLMLFVQHGHLRLHNRPESYFMSVAVKQYGQSRSPASCSDYTYLCHCIHLLFQFHIFNNRL